MLVLEVFEHCTFTSSYYQLRKCYVCAHSYAYCTAKCFMSKSNQERSFKLLFNTFKPFSELIFVYTIIHLRVIPTLHVGCSLKSHAYLKGPKVQVNTHQQLKYDPRVILSRILRRPLKAIYHQQIAHLMQYGVCYQSIIIYIGYVIQGYTGMGKCSFSYLGIPSHQDVLHKRFVNGKWKQTVPSNYVQHLRIALALVVSFKDLQVPVNAR